MPSLRLSPLRLIFPQKAQGAAMRIFLLLWLLVVTSRASAQDDQRFSGNDMVRHCTLAQGIISGQQTPNILPTSSEVFMQGTCLGIIAGIQFFSTEATKDTRYPVCIPTDATLGQILSVVVRYLHQKPHRLHESFIYLALAAVGEAWPCKT
jgi:Rap1a immunity proteins